MAFQKVATVDDLWEGEMQAVRVANREILLVHVNKQIMAFEDCCAHQKARLSEFGRLHAGTLVCTVHEWQYDACSGQGINPASVCLKKFPVQVRDNEIWVDPAQVVA